MTSQQTPSAKKSGGMKITVLVLLLILVMMSYCTYSVYRGYQDYPDWARKDVVMGKHGALIQAVELEIAGSTTMFDLAARLEKLPRANEIMHLEIEHVPGKEEGDQDQFQEEEELVVIGDKNSSYSSSFFLQDDVGYGIRNGLDAIVIKRDVDHLVDVNFVLFYLEHNVAD